jgi:RNA polymerase sigma-54 factor
MSSLKQNLSQKLLQKLSPQQIQFIKLLQLNTLDFEEKLEQELLDNPALETGKSEEEDTFSNAEDIGAEEETFSNDIDIDELLRYNDDEGGFRLNEDYGDDDQRDIPIASSSSFQEFLEEQARATFGNEEDLLLAIHLINSIDEDGYLRRELRAIANDLAFSENIITNEDHLERILIKIQNFDPPGIGARDLQECLLLQLYKKDYGNNPAISLAETIISEYMEAFSKKHYDKIKKALKIDDDALRDAIKEITRLNPKPGMTQGGASKTMYIVPDFIVRSEGGTIEVLLNSRNTPELRLSPAYAETLRAYEASPGKDRNLKDAVQYIKQKLEGARWFIDSVKQRQHTLLSTMEAIVNKQREFFVDGDEAKLKPMILKDIAEKVGLDISTISRVANSKYVETSFGIIPLKFFFSEGIATEDGDEVSNREIKKILKDAIEAENKKRPLTDEALMDLLKERGYHIARRTVAKYREQLNIPVARLRKEI